MLLLASFAAAYALTSPRNGPGLDVGVGLGLGGAPVTQRLAAVVDAGWWVGRYDDQYALGRYWWFGPTLRMDWRPEGVTWAPMFEVRRGVDLLVAGVAPLVVAGPISTPKGWGMGGRAGLYAKLRRTRSLGWFLRLEAGADAVPTRPVTFAGGLLVGGAWSRPVDRI